MRTLPKAEENHRLDGAELEDRIEWSQQVSRGKVEQIEPVQGQGDRDIVDDCDVNVAGICAPVAVVIVTARLQENDDESHHRLHEAELKGCLLAEAEEADGVGFPGQAARSVHARRLDGLAADLRHDVSFATQILVAERQKVVNDES